MTHSFHPWRSTRFSLREKRLVFQGVEGGDKTHEQIVQETEKEAEQHKDVFKEMQDLRKKSQDMSAEQTTKMDGVGKRIASVLNAKVDNALFNFQMREQYTIHKDDPEKQRDVLEKRTNIIVRDTIAQFNTSKLSEHFTAEPKGNEIVLKVKAVAKAPAAAPASAPSSAPASPDKPAAPGVKPKETAAKATPDQAQLDAVRAKLGPNSKAVLDKLPAPSQTIVLRALGKMPGDQAKIEQLMGKAAVAAKVPLILMSAGVIASPKTTPEGLAKSQNISVEDAALVIKFARNIESAKAGPSSGPESAERPEPTTERQRLQYEIDDCMAIIKDPSKGIAEKIGAAMGAFGSMMAMITGYKDLDGPPKKKTEKKEDKKDDKKTEIAGSKPADAASDTPSTPAATSRSRENLAQKATEKGHPSLKAYHDQLKSDESTTKANLEASKGRLAGAKVDEKNLTDRVGVLEKHIAEQGDKATSETKKELAEAKGKLATTKELVKQFTEEVKQSETKYNAVMTDVKALDQLVASTNTMATQLASAMKMAYQSFGGPDWTMPAYARDLEPFFKWQSVQIMPDSYQVEMKYKDTAERAKALTAFRNFATRAGLQPDAVGIDGNGVITDPEVFKNSLQKLTQYLREEHDEKPKRIEKAGKEYIEKIPHVTARSSGGRINYVIQGPNVSPDSALYVIFNNTLNQWQWGQVKNGFVEYKQIGFAVDPTSPDSEKSIYQQYNTYITTLAKINDDRRSGVVSAPSAAPSAPAPAPAPSTSRAPTPDTKNKAPDVAQKSEKKEQESPQQLLQQKIYKVMYNISEYGVDGADTKKSMAELNTMKPSGEILKTVLDNAVPMLSKTDNCHYKLVHLNDAFGIAFDASATRQAVQSRVQRSIALLHTALLDPHMYPEGIVRQLSSTLIALRDNGEPDLQKTCTDLLSAAKFKDKQGKELTFSVDPQTLHVVLEKNPLEVAKEELESRGVEYLTALGFVRTQEGSPYLKPQNGPIKNYPIVVLTDGWKVFMSSSVGGPTDPISITPENALESYSLSSERKSLMENLAKLNAQYRETVEQAKQRRAQS